MRRLKGEETVKRCLLAGMLAAALGLVPWLRDEAKAAGSPIFFLNYQSEDVGSGIWVMNSDGSNARPLMVNTYPNTHHSFFGLAASRDGRHLVLELNPSASAGYSMWLLGVDAARLAESGDIMNEGLSDCFGYAMASRVSCKQSLLSAQDGGRYLPAFHPDGQKVAYVRMQNVAIELFTTDLSGSIRTNVTRNNDAMNALLTGASRGVVGRSVEVIGVVPDGSLSVSPDGQRIAFACSRDTSKDPPSLTSNSDGRAEICTLNWDRTGFRRLTSNKVDDLAPAYSPDGKWIAFDSRRSGNSEIYLMKADGTGVKPLTKMPEASNTGPCFSPDGKKILFASRDKASRHTSIQLMNVDGTGRVNLTANLNGEPLAPVFPGCSSWMRE